MKKINKYQFGGNIDFSKLFESNPLLSGYINKANDFATKFTPSLTPSITTSILGEKPTKMDGNQFAISKGFDLKNNPFAIFKKGFGKLGKQYKEYNNQYNTDINNYNTQTTTLGNSMGPLLGSLSMLIQGMQGEKNYQSSNNDFIDDYQEGGSVEDLMNQDEFLKARGQIESGFNQDSVSSTGAVGMFQIMPIALKEYNRKYDSKYTWDQVKSNAVANAHVSNGLIKDIRSMINKIDTNLSDFDKNVLAEMAYNYGPYRFMDKLKAKGKNVTLQDMLNEKSLPTETRNHGKKFIDYFDKNRQLADKKVLAPRDNTRVVNTLPELKTFKGDPYEYKKEGTQYYFRKNGGEFKPINEAGKRELQRRKFQFGGTAIVDTLSKVANIPIQLFPNDTPENVFLDPKKHLVASVPDPTLIRSGLRQVYDRKTTKQIGFVNEQGQFLPNPIGRGMLSYEGTPPKINNNIPVIQKQLGGTLSKDDKAKLGKLAMDATFQLLPIGNVSTAGKGAGGLLSTIAKKISSIFNKKETPEALRLAQKYLGKDFIPGFRKVDGPHPWSISNHGITHEGRDILIVKNEKTGGMNPFYRRTGNGNRMSDGAENLSTTGEWVPYYGQSNNPNIAPNWFMKPLSGRIGDTPGQIEARNMLNHVMKTGNESASVFRNRFNNSMAVVDDPKAVNSIFRQYGFNPDYYAQKYNIQAHQMGGNINTTGYTPGTPTMNNDHNIIPSNQITMENTPFPVNAYPMNNGQLIGKPVKMKPGLNYYFPNANSVLEIPEKQSGGLISTEDGFSKRKGESRWGYKDNGDGTYSAIDYTRNGKQFLLSDPNNKAYKAVAALFPKSISQPTVNNNSNISTQSPARESSYISQYVQDNQLQTVPEPVQNVSLSQLPQGYNPYSYSGQPQTISQEQLNQNIPISYFDKNTALSGALATGLTIAPMGKVLSPLLGKLTSLFTSKKYVSPNNYKKLVDNIFDGVKKEVKEIPGRASRAKSKSYNEGVQKVFSGRNPVYEKYGGYISKYQYGGEAQEPELVPIQTEKGEKIYHLDGSISNVGAKKLHKNMDNDEITDVVLSGSFIASRDPQMKISKKEASNIILGNHAVKYEQGKPVKPPKDIKFSDIFKKRYHTPAQLTDIIDKKFKISDKPNNIFTKQANEWNKESRDQYMNIVKYMTEVKKPAESNQYKYGGKVEKHQLGGIISGALQLIPQVANMFTQNANKNATLSDISKYETQNRGYLQNQIGIGGLSNLLGYATQDLTPEMYDPSQVLNELSRPYNQALSSIPYRQNQNLSQSRAASNNAYSRLANIDPRLAYASASTIGSNGLRDANQINSQLDAYRDNLSTQLGQQRSSIVRDSLLNRQQTLANTRSNRNLLNSGLFSNFAQLGNDYYGGLSNINNTGLAARMGARGQYANFLTNMNYGMGNSLSQIANGISGLGKSTSAPAPTPYNFNTVNNSIRNYRANYNRQEFQDVHDSYPFLNQSPLSYLAPIKR